MTGFDKDWLALREPTDIRARDKSLMTAAIETFEDAGARDIVDIGCGTGSNFRALSPKFVTPKRWRLFDHDLRLLEEAARLHGHEVELVQGDLNDIQALPLDGADLVTASALFDLCSETFIERFVERITTAGIGLYAALSYDGNMQWSKPHPLDEVVTANFNAHQQTDKGFGPSLGPKAWKTLEERLRQTGYKVRTAESPWIMGIEDHDLQKAFLEGLMRAILDTRELDESELRDWIDFRRKMIARTDSLCRVGHQDILALR